MKTPTKKLIPPKGTILFEVSVDIEIACQKGGRQCGTIQYHNVRYVTACAAQTFYKLRTS